MHIVFDPVQSIVSLIRALKFQPGLWVESLDPDLPPPPHSPLLCQSPFSSPSLLRSVPCPLIILCPVTHWCDHSFIHSYTHSLGKYLRDWSQLISLIHLLPLFLPFCQKLFLSWILFLVYISAFTYLLQISSVLHKIFSFYEIKDDFCFERTLLCLFFTKASDSQSLHSNLKKKKVKSE